MLKMNISFFTILKDGLLSAPKIGWRTTSPVNEKYLIFVSRFLFIPERETCCMLSICRAFAFLAFIRKPSASLSLLQSARIAPSRESNMDSCRLMSLGSYRPANLMIRTDSKRSLRLFDMDSDRPFYFFEPGWDTEVVSGWKISLWVVYRNTRRIDFHPEARDMLRSAILFFFELSGDSEVVLRWKILFGTVYGNTWGMDFSPQNKIWTIMGPLSRPRSKILRVAVSRIILSSEASKVKLVGNLVA